MLANTIKRCSKSAFTLNNSNVITIICDSQGSFVIGWMPGVMIYVLVCDDCVFQFNWVSPRAMFFIYTMINGLIILKTLVNPIIYAARMHEIKVNRYVSIAWLFKKTYYIISLGSQNL
jgi:hypothetical protein